MNAQLKAVEERRDALLTEARALLDRTEALEGADLERFQQIETELEELKKRHTQLDTLIRAAENPANRESGDSTRDPIPGIHRTDPFDLTEIPTFGREPRQIAADYRSRALDAIERVERGAEVMTDEMRENATRIVERSDRKGGISEYILKTGHPDYISAFERYIEDPMSPPAYTAEETRALREVANVRTALSLTGANGGYLVPFFLDPSIILTNNGATNPMRLIADVKTIAVNTWHGVASAGVTAEWIAEATEVADASPTFSQPTIPTYKADAYVQASWEVIADSGISSELGMLIADAKDRLEATAFVTGTGSGQPTGVVTAVGGVTASRVAGSSGAAGAADFVVADVYGLQNALPPRYRPNSSWMAEQTTYNAIRRFATGSGPQHAFWADLGVAIPPLLLGRPAYESSAMDNTVVSGSNDDVLLLGDFRHGYKIIDRVGMTLLFEPIVKGSSRRPTGEAAWVAYWRTGGDSPDPNALRLLRL